MFAVYSAYVSCGVGGDAVAYESSVKSDLEGVSSLPAPSKSFGTMPPSSMISFSSILILLVLSSFFAFSYSYRYINSWIESSRFTFALFLIFFARAPNFIVDIVSSRLNFAGLHVMMRLVFALPPRDS